MAEDLTHADDDHPSLDKTFLYVFVVLCICTAISFGADFLPKLGVGNGAVNVIVLAIAVAKALCVMLFFMHLKWERNWKYVILAPTVVLSIGLPVALIPDIGVHYYLQNRTETTRAASEAVGNDSGDSAKH